MKNKNNKKNAELRGQLSIFDEFFQNMRDFGNNLSKEDIAVAIESLNIALSEVKKQEARQKELERKQKEEEKRRKAEEKAQREKERKAAKDENNVGKTAKEISRMTEIAGSTRRKSTALKNIQRNIGYVPIPTIFEDVFLSEEEKNI